MMKHITAKELKAKMDAGDDFILVDVLSPMSYEVKHLPKAVNMPISELLAKAKKVFPDKDKEIIVYCASEQCHASTDAAKKLVELGYSKVVEFDGGLKEWEEEGFDFE